MVHNQLDTFCLLKLGDNKPFSLIVPGGTMAARSSLTIEDRITIVILMLSPTRQYGDATALAQTYGVSRQALYDLRDQGRPALKTALTPRSGPVATDVTLIVTPERLQRAIVLLTLLGVSERDMCLALTEVLDTSRSLGYVARIIRKAERLAQARNAELTPALSGLLASDELFLHAQPILGSIHPASLYLVSLTLAAQRDGETWGCEFLEHGQADGMISDAGKGLAAGADLAHLPCHVGDWFHPLLLAGLVAAQYERRAYAALAQQYQREEQIWQARTAKRLENHWRKWEAEQAAAAQAIATYDQWRLLRLRLRALAAQFDWTTGCVSNPGRVQADLLALAEELDPWAQGTQAKDLVSLLRHQAQALTAALPLLQQALIPLQQAWGEAATHVVCRLWQALQDWAFPFWTPEQRRQLEHAITESLAWASTHLGAHLEVLQHLVAAILAQWPRTSSAIECLNSLLRPFLNGRKQVAQGFLELFRFYHNTHPFVRGPRLGHSPLELAGGPRIEDPLAFLGLGEKS
ncbi:MAG: hypothetical protein WCS72_11455 [Deltaproteobacteria bacterium]